MISTRDLCFMDRSRVFWRKDTFPMKQTATILVRLPGPINTKLIQSHLWTVPLTMEGLRTGHLWSLKEGTWSKSCVEPTQDSCVLRRHSSSRQLWYSAMQGVHGRIRNFDRLTWRCDRTSKARLSGSSKSFFCRSTRQELCINEDYHSHPLSLESSTNLRRCKFLRRLLGFYCFRKGKFGK